MADRSGSPLCLAMVDLDAFKAFNDSRGHLEGDHLLRLVAAVLASRVRSTDLVCRYGGDEFCLLLPATDQTGAQELLEDLRASWPVPWPAPGSPSRRDWPPGTARNRPRTCWTAPTTPFTKPSSVVETAWWWPARCSANPERSGTGAG